MKFYLAAKFETRPELIWVKNELERLGHKVTSRWLTREEATKCEGNFWAEVAAIDLMDISDCDVFVLDTITQSSRGGKEVEFGVALEAGKQLVVIGPEMNVFHYLTTARFVNWSSFITWVAGLPKED